MNIHTAANRKTCHEYAAANPHLDRNELVLKEWAIGAGCSDHDAQNSLKLAMDPCHPVSAQNTYDDLHIAIASLRNGFDIIIRNLPDWLIGTARFCDEVWEDAYVFWTSLQVEPMHVEELVDLQLRFENGYLKLRSSLQDTDNWVDRVSCVLMVLWRFKNFTASQLPDGSPLATAAELWCEALQVAYMTWSVDA